MSKEIIKGINMGFRECEYQFRSRRWNCTSIRKSMRKILMKGKSDFTQVLYQSCVLLLNVWLIKHLVNEARPTCSNYGIPKWLHDTWFDS